MQEVMYDLHFAHERTHWWYTARRDIVLSLLRPELQRKPRLHDTRLLDIGCGGGGMLEWLRTFGDAVGVDPSSAAVDHARAATGLDVRQGALPHEMPFRQGERFDVVTMLDVLEHIDDDAASLAAVRELLRPDGLFIITVPAFRFLWSGHDVVNEHRRRYTRHELRRRLEQAGFRIGRLSYCNTSLFLPIAAVRLLRRLGGEGEPRPDVGRVAEPLNTMLHHLFAAERHALRVMSLPFGVSLIATARRA